MKKTAIIVCMALLVPAAARAADPLLLFSIAGNYLRPADAGYRAIYGNQVFYAEFDAGIRLYGGVYVLGGYGRLSKTGTTPELELETRSMQQFISVGFGYIRQISGLLNVGPSTARRPWRPGSRDRSRASRPPSEPCSWGKRARSLPASSSPILGPGSRTRTSSWAGPRRPSAWGCGYSARIRERRRNPPSYPPRRGWSGSPAPAIVSA
jgi:hypothetical protein